MSQNADPTRWLRSLGDKVSGHYTQWFVAWSRAHTAMLVVLGCEQVCSMALHLVQQSGPIAVFISSAAYRIR